MSASTHHVPSSPVRFVTAASLFDGREAAINISEAFFEVGGQYRRSV